MAPRADANAAFLRPFIPYELFTIFSTLLYVARSYGQDMASENKPPNVRWSPHVDAPVWPWLLAGWLLAVLFMLLFILARP